MDIEASSKQPQLTEYLCKTLNTLAVAYKSAGNLKDSLHCLLKLLQMGKLSGSKPMLSVTYRNISHVLLDMDRPTDAIKWGEKAIAILREQPSESLELILAYLNVADAHCSVQSFDDALRFYGSAADAAKTSGLRDRQLLERIARGMSSAKELKCRDEQPKVDELDRILMKTCHFYQPKLPERNRTAVLRTETSESTEDRSFRNPYSTQKRPTRLVRPNRTRGNATLKTTESSFQSISKKLDLKNVQLAYSLNRTLGTSFKAYLLHRPHSANIAHHTEASAVRPVSADLRTEPSSSSNSRPPAVQPLWKVSGKKPAPPHESANTGPLQSIGVAPNKHRKKAVSSVERHLNIVTPG
jgi:tetratricopeptide (TPR) repeat protein